MEITEVRIKLMEDSDDRLQAFCSITFDNAFVIRDLKIIDGANGPFVAMPSRKLTAHCPYCNCKNHLRAAYCNQCGKRLREERAPRDADGRAKLYADVAHPINPQCREMIQTRVIAEFEAELDRAEEPGYVSRYDEDYDLDVGPEVDEVESPARPTNRTPMSSSRPASSGAAQESASILPPPPALPSAPLVPPTPVAKPAASHPQPPVLPPPRTEAPSIRREAPRRDATGASPVPAVPASAPAADAARTAPAAGAETRSSGPQRTNAGDRGAPPARPRPARGEFGAGIFEEP